MSLPFSPRPSVSWAPHPLVRLARRPGLYWIFGLALALASGWVAYTGLNKAATAEASYGQTEVVLVAVADAQPGDLVAATAQPQSVPRALLPEGALSSDPGGVEAVLARPVRAGAILTDLDTGTPQSTDPNSATIAVPSGPATPPLYPGQTVVAVLHQDAFSGQAGALVDAVVVDANETKVLLRVGVADLQALSTAIANNAITIALR